MYFGIYIYMANIPRAEICRGIFAAVGCFCYKYGAFELMQGQKCCKVSARMLPDKSGLKISLRKKIPWQKLVPVCCPVLVKKRKIKGIHDAVLVEVRKAVCRVVDPVHIGIIKRIDLVVAIKVASRQRREYDSR